MDDSVNSLNHKILTLLGKGSSIDDMQVIQELWGGYGQLLRLTLTGHKQRNSIIAKYIQLPELDKLAHPRGWNTPLSHQRKLMSYQVEFHWYANYVKRMPTGWVPACLSSFKEGSHYLLVLQDLRDIGRARVVTQATQSEIMSVLNWLAQFHAFWLGEQPDGLWDQGAYWHLSTRPDELLSMTNTRYQRAARTLDKLLEECPYKTIIHGDAKLANFCFEEEGDAVSGVDFQYVGAGVGVKDVVLLLTSVLDFNKSDIDLAPYLSHYFSSLKHALEVYQPTVESREVCEMWSRIFDLAWADFQRFLLGWCPTHWKVNEFTMALTDKALERHGL
ncbi:phosphotransferase [Vibrio sp. E150_011]